MLNSIQRLAEKKKTCYGRNNIVSVVFSGSDRVLLQSCLSLGFPYWWCSWVLHFSAEPLLAFARLKQRLTAL